LIDQIAVLLALTAGLFDRVSLEKVNEAEQALRQAAAENPTELAGRLSAATELSNADRKTILEMATRALASFQASPDDGSDAKAAAA
jgi:F-type H+-transporting ATPase subunit alpha